MTAPLGSARALAATIRSGAMSAAEAMAATYDRIDAWNPHVNALIALLTRDAALELARAADDQQAAAARAPLAPPLGPLHGLPIAIKDSIDVAGFPTAMGSPLLARRGAAPRDDLMAARLKAAGAIVIGKTTTPEFCIGSHTVSPVHGVTRNPWDLSRSAGGSSGGAAAALASGMLPLADGSDMMGSLRNPAGWTGVYALRPSWGAAPSEPLGDTFLHQLATLGPMARDPDDLALLFAALAGPDPRQPHSAALSAAPPRGALRIGWLANWEGAYAVGPGVMGRCEAALSVLEGLGHAVEPCAPGFAADDLWRSWTTLRSWQLAASLKPLAELEGGRAQMKPDALWELDRGLRLSAMAVHDASVLRSRWFAHAAQLFEAYDVLALPTAQCLPFRLADGPPAEIAGRPMDVYHRWMEVVVPASLAGLPALAVPAGFGDDGAAPGLPMGLQLIGPRGADHQLIALGRAFHAAAPWAGAAPRLPH